MRNIAKFFPNTAQIDWKMQKTLTQAWPETWPEQNLKTRPEGRKTNPTHSYFRLTHIHNYWPIINKYYRNIELLYSVCILVWNTLVARKSYKVLDLFNLFFIMRADDQALYLVEMPIYRYIQVPIILMLEGRRRQIDFFQNTPPLCLALKLG